MHQTNNSIPGAYQPLITLGRKALTGVISIGAEVEVEQNTAAKISADLYNLIGNPATPLTPGRQQLFLEQRTAVKNAYTAKEAAHVAGREYCRLAINLLRPVLGNRWNTSWLAAGFTQPSLALPDEPAALLTALRGYFAANPSRENALAGITAGQAQAHLAAIDATTLNVGTARSARLLRKAERDVAIATLRARLSGLRAELDQLLSDDDGRWYEFGFRRPADGSMPSLVRELVLTAGAPGIVLVSWAASSLAEKYRVRWSVVGSSGAPIDLGLVSDPQFALTDLPSGTMITVAVTARNDSGETAATEAQIVVP